MNVLAVYSVGAKTYIYLRNCMNSTIFCMSRSQGGFQSELKTKIKL